MFLKEGNVLKLGHSGDCTLLSACRHVSHTLRVGVLGQTCLPTSWAHCMTQPLCHLPVLPQVLCGSRQAPCPLSAPPPPLPPSTSVHPSISPSAHVVGRLKAPCRPPSHSPAASAHDQPRAGPTLLFIGQSPPAFTWQHTPGAGEAGAQALATESGSQGLHLPRAGLGTAGWGRGNLPTH